LVGRGGGDQDGVLMKKRERPISTKGGKKKKKHPASHRSAARRYSGTRILLHVYPGEEKRKCLRSPLLEKRREGRELGSSAGGELLEFTAFLMKGRGKSNFFWVKKSGTADARMEKKSGRVLLPGRKTGFYPPPAKVAKGW